MSTYAYDHVTVDSVHDGDTLHVTMDFGMGLKLGMSCRIYGINAPELSTQAGKDALAYALSLVKPGDQVQVVSYGYDKYGGRFDGKVTLPDGSDFGTQMVNSGHAVAI